MIWSGSQWYICLASKRTKNNESGAYTISSNANTSVGVKADEVEVCPIGQKAVNEKDKLKRKGKEKDNGESITHISNEKWNEWKEKMEAKIQIGEQIKKLAKFDILPKDILTMTSEQLEMHKKICKII